MRKIIWATFWGFISLLLITTGCEKYDDSALVARMDKVESDISQLKTLVEQLNTSLSGLATTVDALKDQDRIVSVTEMTDKSGWVVEFSKSGKINIYNGKNGIDGSDGTNGTNGKDGTTPTIGVKLDDDGNYYWTVNGDYLLDENNKKIAATAHVATPQIKIEDGYFWFSSNNGATWEKIGEAGNAGSVIFSDVKDGNDAVTFTLADGTVIVVPKVQKFAINVPMDVIISAGETKSFDYSLTGADEETVIDAFGTKGFEVTITPSTYTSGSVTVSAPDPLTEGKVYMIAVKGDGTTTAKILSCEKGVFTLDETAFLAKVPASGGTFEVNFQTNQDNPVAMVDPSAQSWIHLIETKAIRNGIIVFSIDENTAEEERTGKVRINFVEYTIMQEGKVASPETGGGTADFETFNNGQVKISIGNYETTSGWKLTNGIVQGPGNLPVITTLSATLLGRVNRTGVLTSPIISNGIGLLKFNYGTSYAAANGLSFKIEIKNKDGETLNTETITNNTIETNTKYSVEKVFNITGDFQIVITNLCPSNKSTGFVDMAAIFDLEWTGYSE